MAVTFKQFNIFRVMPICFILSALTFLFFFRDTKEVPIKDFIFFLTATFAIFSFTFFLLGQLIERVSSKTKLGPSEYFYKIFSSIVFAGAIAVLMIILGYLLNDAYAGAIVLRFAGMISAGAVASFASYYALGESTRVDSLLITKYLSTFMFGGLLLSALAQTDPNWYAVSFSYLGMTEGTTSAIIFNATMILTGLGTIALSKYIFDDIGKSSVRKNINDKSLRTDRIIFFLMGAGIAVVGLIPYAEGIQGSLHTAGAMSAGLSFLYLSIFSKRLLGGLNKTFYTLTYSFSAIVVASGLAFLMGEASLATTELIVFIAVFVWVYLFLEVIKINEQL